MGETAQLVRMNDFTREPQALRDSMVKRFDAVLESGHYVLGPQVSEFEAQFAARCGVGHAIGVGNGLDAIEIGLRAAGIAPGDEVITTPMTAVASVIGIIRAGATPVLADIDSGTGLLDVASVERCITARTRAILLVHLYGKMSNIDAWLALCDEHGIYLVEDCAQAHDASDQGRSAGSLGRFGAFSFYPTKNLGAVGDGGALTTKDDAIGEYARKFRNYGQATRYVHDIEGSNSRLDEVQAALLLARLPWLTNFSQRRREVATRYFEELSNPQVLPMKRPEDPLNHVHHLFVVRSPDRDGLAAHLRAHGIENLVHYPIPVHRQVPYSGLQRDPQGLKAADEHSNRCLSIPCAPHLTDEEVTRVVEAVNSFRMS